MASALRSYFIPFVFFLILWMHGAHLGLTDDEAYYWVLAQRPALGYAFHPPAVAWLVALFQSIFGSVFGTHSVGLVRLPAVLGITGVLVLSLQWLRSAGLPRMGQSRASCVFFFLRFFPPSLDDGSGYSIVYGLDSPLCLYLESLL